MIPRADRLYGVEGAERLYDDPATVYESEIEGFDEHPADSYTIIEWSIVPQRNHLPSADTLLEWVAEWASENGEVDEEWSDHIFDCLKLPDVREAAEALLALAASKNQYRMADKELRRLTITFDENGEPLLDGERMYTMTPPQGEAGR